MNKILPLLLIILLVQGTPTWAEELELVDPESVGLSSHQLDQIGQLVDEAVAGNVTAGAVVLVLRRGKIAHFSAHGYQDLENKRRMRRNTLFRIYSMTKPITTVAAMMLWEQGRFQLDDAVSKYLPEFKGVRVLAGATADEAAYVAAKPEMTVRDLMRHTSGLTYGGGKGPCRSALPASRLARPQPGAERIC